MLFRDESMQVETASTMMALANHETQTSDGKSLDIRLIRAMSDE